MVERIAVYMASNLLRMPVLQGGNLPRACGYPRHGGRPIPSAGMRRRTPMASTARARTARSMSRSTSASAAAFCSGGAARDRRMPAMTSAIAPLPSARCGGVCPARLCAQPMVASRRVMVDGARPASASPAQNRATATGSAGAAARRVRRTRFESVANRRRRSDGWKQRDWRQRSRAPHPLPGPPPGCCPAPPARCRPCLPSPTAASARTLGCLPPACQTAAAPSAARILSGNIHFVREYLKCPEISDSRTDRWRNGFRTETLITP